MTKNNTSRMYQVVQLLNNGDLSFSAFILLLQLRSAIVLWMVVRKLNFLYFRAKNSIR